MNRSSALRWGHDLLGGLAGEVDGGRQLRQTAELAEREAALLLQEALAIPDRGKPAAADFDGQMLRVEARARMERDVASSVERIVEDYNRGLVSLRAQHAARGEALSRTQRANRAALARLRSEAAALDARATEAERLWVGLSADRAATDDGAASRRARDEADAARLRVEESARAMGEEEARQAWTSRRRWLEDALQLAAARARMFNGDAAEREWRAWDTASRGFVPAGGRAAAAAALRELYMTEHMARSRIAAAARARLAAVVAVE